LRIRIDLRLLIDFQLRVDLRLRIETVRRSNCSSMERLQTDPCPFSASDPFAASDRSFVDFPGELRFEVRAESFVRNAEGRDETNRRVGLGRSRIFPWQPATDLRNLDAAMLAAGELCSVISQIGLESVIHSPCVTCSFVQPAIQQLDNCSRARS
jgi:hypothetical protein